MAENEFQPAYDLLTALPIALREDAEIGRLLIHLGFILAAQVAPPPFAFVDGGAQDSRIIFDHVICTRMS